MSRRGAKRHSGSGATYSRPELAAKYGNCIEEVAFTGTYEQLVAGMEDFARKEGGKVVRNNEDGTVTWIAPDGARVTMAMGGVQ